MYWIGMFRYSVGDIYQDIEHPYWDLDANHNSSYVYIMIFIIYTVFVSFIFMMVIVLLNFLIAVIFQTFQYSMMNQARTNYKLKAELNREFCLIKDRLGLGKELDWFILTSETSSNGSSGNQQQGMITAIKNVINAENRKVKERLMYLAKEMRDGIFILKKKESFFRDLVSSLKRPPQADTKHTPLSTLDKLRALVAHLEAIQEGREEMKVKVEEYA